MPVPKMMLNMGAPMMLSMVSLALYNIVDTLFVSRIPDTALIAEMGDKAVNAISLVHPVQVLIISLGVSIGIGINTQTAHNLGKKDYETVSKTAGNAILIAGGIYLFMLLLGIFATRPYIYSQTDNPVIAEMAISYMHIITILSFGTVGHMCVEKIVMATGRTTQTMIAQLSGAIVNIILDPAFIFGWFGKPMGIKGAAYATIIGQCVSFAIILFFLFRKCPEVQTGLRYLKPYRSVLKATFAIAIPATVMQLMTPIMGYGMNLILGRISPSAITAYGIYGRIQYFVTMLIFGLNNASIPSASFNRGSKNFNRVSEIIKWGLIYASIIMIIFMIVLQLFVRQITGIFSVSESSMNFAVKAVRIISCGYLFLGANIMLQGICQAMGKGMRSMIVTMIRCVIAALPLAYLFSTMNNAGTLVWIAIPAAEAIGFIFCVFLTYDAYKKAKAATE